MAEDYKAEVGSGLSATPTVPVNTRGEAMGGSERPGYVQDPTTHDLLCDVVAALRGIRFQLELISGQKTPGDFDADSDC